MCSLQRKGRDTVHMFKEYKKLNRADFNMQEITWKEYTEAVEWYRALDKKRRKKWLAKE